MKDKTIIGTRSLVNNLEHIFASGVINFKNPSCYYFTQL